MDVLDTCSAIYIFNSLYFVDHYSITAPKNSIYTDSRHSTNYSKRSSDCKANLPINLTRPPNTACYITDITIPVNGYTVQAGTCNTIYTIDSVDKPIVPLNALSLKETIAPLRFALLSVT